jgi:hypothetical protein
MGGSNPYRTHSIIGSVGRPVAYPGAVDHNPSFSSASSFEYVPPASMAPGVPPPTMMMMQPSQQVQPMTFMQPQQPVQAMSVMQQQTPVQHMGMMQPQQSVQQQIMYRPVQMQSSMPQMTNPQYPSNYVPQNYMYPTHQGMSFGYRPMMQPGRMIPSGMPMMTASNTFGTPATSFPSHPPMFNPMAQQLVY